MSDITTVILTYNEEKNIRECIDSIKGISKRIIVVDSYSDDKTVEYARELGAEIYFNRFENHSKQFRYGIEISQIQTKWIFRIDADERLTEASAKEIEILCNENTDTDINGIVVRFEVNFLGKKLRHGGIYPFKKLLVYKKEYGQIEDRNMDEHIYLTEGKSVELKNDSLHNDYKDLTFWINKHNKYSTMEVNDYFDNANKSNELGNLEKNAKIKRFFKYKIYYKLPIGMRALLYFCYRYFIKMGFLDGKEGLIFSVLQAFWYRFLVDAKIYEKQINKNKERY